MIVSKNSMRFTELSRHAHALVSTFRKRESIDLLRDSIIASDLGWHGCWRLRLHLTRLWRILGVWSVSTGRMGGIGRLTGLEVLENLVVSTF